ncbi:uncharacterized protein V1518DRAFT_410293 [Limtongia smithiae]|uniref:uncharacterized protein n=1 Tax=Limtongia smithiae TaxID=1125753 RepID=UPI0034CF4674
MPSVVLDHRGPPIAVVYLSETGTSQSLAERLGRRLRRLRFRAAVLGADDLARVAAVLFAASNTHPKTANDEVPIVILLCATTGNGEMPRHARRLWRFLLRRALPATALAGLPFTTFGLGDTSYAHFNFAARKMHKRLLQLGAHELCPRGEGDESASGGVEAAYAVWEQVLANRLQDLYACPPGVNVLSDDVLLKPEMPVTVEDGSTAMKQTTRDDVVQSRVCGPVRAAVVVRNERITPPTHFQDTRAFHIKLSADTPGIVPGATILVYPENDSDDVSTLITAQDWTAVADVPLAVPATVRKWATTTPLTLRTLLTYHLDIGCVPRASFFEVASFFSSGNEQQREKLRELGDAGNEEFTQDRYDYADRPRRSALECLLEFDSVKLPLEYILDVFQPLRPRQFSVAQYDAATAEVGLLVAIVKYRTILRRIRQGVVTRFMARLAVGNAILVEVSAPQTPPPPADKPVLLVGPGTGVAPLHFLMAQRLSLPRDAESPSTLLVFGNRLHDSDFYYHKEWLQHPSASESRSTASGISVLTITPSTKILACFSRDHTDDDTAPRLKYVQSALKITSVAREVGDMLAHNGGYVWVCGSKGKMPKAVRAAIHDALEATLGKGEGMAAISVLEKQGRYIEETW